MKQWFPTAKTNANRADAGSAEGIAGRTYPVLVARRLDNDIVFRKKICELVHHNVGDYKSVRAGRSLVGKVASVCGGHQTALPKTTLQIIWKDGRHTNFIVKKSGPAQICLKRVENFIPEFEAQFKKTIPPLVKEALLLFIGRHARQKEILDSISVNYVGETIRNHVERSYHNRLTLASMYGYNELMAGQLMNWFRENSSEIFAYCFSLGAAKSPFFAAEFLWYHSANDADSDVEIINLNALISKIKSLSKEQVAPMVRPRDRACVGSTIDLPFGNLQYHEDALQFRHDRDKINMLVRMSIERVKNRFGSRPKESGHENERLIAKALNDDREFRTHFCERVGKDVSEFKAAEAGGKHAKQEKSVLGGFTAGKTDVAVFWKNGTRTNISVKKRAAGQVYLVTVKNFISAYQAQYHVVVPHSVVRALQLFVGEAMDSKTILDATDISIDGAEVRDLERKKNNRLVFDVIYHYDARMANDLLAWLKDEIVRVFEISFAAGAVADKNEWSDVLWYKNLVDIEGDGLDYMVSIKQVMLALEKNRENNVVAKGPKNGGSTLQLPFGHLQYHLKQLEFYQQMKKIQALINLLAA